MIVHCLLSLGIPHLYYKNWRRAVRYLGCRGQSTHHVREQRKLLWDFHHTYVDIAAVRTVEVWLEALPQMVLQAYIIASAPLEASKSQVLQTNLITDQIRINKKLIFFFSFFGFSEKFAR